MTNNMRLRSRWLGLLLPLLAVFNPAVLALLLYSLHLEPWYFQTFVPVIICGVAMWLSFRGFTAGVRVDVHSETIEVRGIVRSHKVRASDVLQVEFRRSWLFAFVVRFSNLDGMHGLVVRRGERSTWIPMISTLTSSKGDRRVGEIQYEFRPLAVSVTS